MEGKITENGKLSLEGLKMRLLPNVFTFKKFDNVTQLVVKGNQLTEISELMVKGLPKLISLDAQNNSISEITPTIDQWKDTLVELWIGSNQIKELPQQIVKLNVLQHLKLADNKIKKLPDMMNRLVNLKRLDIWDNQIE